MGDICGVAILCIACLGVGIEIGMSEGFARLMRVRVFRLSDWKEFFRNE